MSDTAGSYAPHPLHGFRFEITVREDDLPGESNRVQVEASGAPVETSGGSPSSKTLCQGAFSEVTGLEATVEPFAISEGGRNWGQHQRVGLATFSTVILRRGVTTNRELWKWFQGIHGRGAYKKRLKVTIRLRAPDTRQGAGPAIEWELSRAMPVKMKLADLNAAAQEVALEELHFVHEGITERSVEGAR